MAIDGSSGVNINAGAANGATLSYSPDTNAPNLAIATVGYVKDKVKGYTGNLSVISAVEWTGTVLRKKTSTWKMKDGLLTEAPTESAWQTIDTPVVYP